MQLRLYFLVGYYQGICNYLYKEIKDLFYTYCVKYAVKNVVTLGVSF